MGLEEQWIEIFVSSVLSKSVNFHIPVHKAAVTVSALLLP